MKYTSMTEDGFLAARVAEGHPVYCWLASGVKLEGTILAFDADTISMRPHASNGDEDVMLIFKMQIASIVPAPKKRNSR